LHFLITDFEVSGFPFSSERRDDLGSDMTRCCCCSRTHQY